MQVLVKGSVFVVVVHVVVTRGAAVLPDGPAPSRTGPRCPGHTAPVPRGTDPTARAGRSPW
ncbi:hypothetical protein BB341_17495 [Streptomyces clavuligerus]|uniref:Uncharacterized protein n=1 Tax=Streptomyces clavuligerus TaxID=1901 RepID=E2Q6C0_STRCL|nr:hypothetical protein BB341_17495 [Streptomyces clavuligerus]EFG07244.1 Hypothetical protein SCLAV_2171 [Streptomyces clavuligerus]